jgi:hypothetical protein
MVLTIGSRYISVLKEEKEAAAKTTATITMLSV